MRPAFRSNGGSVPAGLHWTWLTTPPNQADGYAQNEASGGAQHQQRRQIASPPLRRAGGAQQFLYASGPHPRPPPPLARLSLPAIRRRRSQRQRYGLLGHWPV